jgi:hypothetical protein
MRLTHMSCPCVRVKEYLLTRGPRHSGLMKLTPDICIYYKLMPLESAGIIPTQFATVPLGQPVGALTGRAPKWQKKLT